MLPTNRRQLVEDTLYADMTQVARFSAHLLNRPLRLYQQEVATAIVDSVLQAKGLTFAVMMSRQAGKNETSAHIEAFLMNYFQRRGGNIVKVSPTFKPQTINSVLRLEALFERSDLPNTESQHGYMLCVGRARCSFYSGAPGASVVGATADILLEADEAQDLDATKWNKEFRPMGASTNVTSVLWGTAWTANTLLAETVRSLRLREAQDGQRRVFAIPWPRVAKELPAYGRYVRAEIDRLGPQHPLIRTQYDLEEITARGGMFPVGLRLMMRGQHARARQPVDCSPRTAEGRGLTRTVGRGQAHVITLDVAGEAEDRLQGSFLRTDEPRRDSTALTVFSVEHMASATPRTVGGSLPRYLVQDRYLWTGAPHHGLLPAIVQIARIWGAVQIIVDATGIGAGLTSFLRAELGERVMPFIFGATSKSQLGWDFLALCNSGRFLDHADDGSPEQAQFWREVEAADYEIVDDASRRMRWGVADPHIHDDLLISAALIAAAEPTSAPQPSVIIEADDALARRRSIL